MTAPADASAPPAAPSRGPWTDGHLWLVSANATEAATARCFEQAGHATNRVAMLEADTLMPPTVRHVALPTPRPPLAPLLREILSAPGRPRPQRDTPPDDAPTARAPRRRRGGKRRAAVVFVSSAHEAAELENELASSGVRTASVHASDADDVGARREARRARGAALDALRNRQVDVLLCTDMLARGVDVRGATHVINASIPADAATYLHRAGRVGRLGGAAGTVVSLPKNGAEVERLRGYAHELGVALETHVEEKQQQAAEAAVAAEADAAAGNSDREGSPI